MPLRRHILALPCSRLPKRRLVRASLKKWGYVKLPRDSLGRKGRLAHSKAARPQSCANDRYRLWRLWSPLIDTGGPWTLRCRASAHQDRFTIPRTMQPRTSRQDVSFSQLRVLARHVQHCLHDEAAKPCLRKRWQSLRIREQISGDGALVLRRAKLERPLHGLAPKLMLRDSSQILADRARDAVLVVWRTKLE